jgi:hypothetical protein
VFGLFTLCIFLHSRSGQPEWVVVFGGSLFYDLANGSLCRESCTHQIAGTSPTHKWNPAIHVHVPMIQLKPIYWVIPQDGPTEDFVLLSQVCGSTTGLLWPRSGVMPRPFLLPDTCFG